MQQCKLWHYVLASIIFIFLFKNLSLSFYLNDLLAQHPLSHDVSLATKDANATTVAFVVTITSCDNHFGREKFYAFDGAAVLAYSIRKNSIHGHNGGRYDYDLYVFYHPSASKCALPLEQLGYIVQERDTPVTITDIANEEFRTQLQSSGCCGERELIKFEAFTLTQYPVVVLLDADTLVLKPLDRLFDSIIDAAKVPDPDDLMYRGIPIPDRIDLLYTTDNPTAYMDQIIKPTQGGFVVFRPNMTVYYDIIEIVKKGDFQSDGGGWGGRTGIFWGSTTFQGLIPYYFQILYPGRALELNYCVWNDNNFSPKQEITETANTQCDPYEENCEDCRLRPIEKIGLVHYTICYKPWFCYIPDGNDRIHNKQCRVLLHEWFSARSEMERSWGRAGKGKRRYKVDTFLGFCSRRGLHGYQPIEEPFGKPLLESNFWFAFVLWS